MAMVLVLVLMLMPGWDRDNEMIMYRVSGQMGVGRKSDVVTPGMIRERVYDE